MNGKKYLMLPLLFILFFVFGCTHSVKLVEFESGQVLHGEFNELSGNVKVTMPDGELLTGKYSALDETKMMFGNAFATDGLNSASAFGSGFSSGGKHQAYALLNSDASNLIMEVVVTYSKWNNQGYGKAVTNDGREFKVQF